MGWAVPGDRKKWEEMRRNLKKKKRIPLFFGEKSGISGRKNWDFLISGGSTEVVATEDWRKTGRNFKKRNNFFIFGAKFGISSFQVALRGY